MLKITITLAWLWAGFAARSQAPLRSVDSILTTMAAHQLFNGSLLIAEEGRIVYERSFGYLDRTRHIPNSDTAVVNLASLSKPFTSLAVLQLVQAGRVALDSPCFRYLPGFPYPTVKVRHLLTHTSGLPSLERFYDDYIHEHPDELITNQSAYDRLLALRPALLYTPGDQWGYNNFNYLVLALLVQQVSGMRFADYMRAHVFLPAGMRSTYIREPAMPNNVRYFRPAMYFTDRVDVDSLGHGEYYTDYNLGGIQGPGNVMSTLRDLLRFDNALRSGGLVDTALLDTAFRAVLLNQGDTFHFPGSTRSYGMGWNVYHNKTAPFTRFAFHDGHISGMMTFLNHTIDKNETIICYDNMDNPPLSLMISVSNLLNGLPPRKMSLAFSLARLYGATMAASGIDAATAVFNEWRDDSAHYYVDELELNRLGYDFLSATMPHHLDYALEVFKVNTLLFPHSGNTYDSYAQVLEKTGHRAEAIAMYRKSIQLWPGNEEGKKALERLLGN